MWLAVCSCLSGAVYILLSVCSCLLLYVMWLLVTVGERKHPYEECHPEDEEDKPDPGTQEQYKGKAS